MRRTITQLATVMTVGSLLSAGGCRTEARVKDYSFFLEQLTDLDRLAVLEEGIRTKQWSSYDRASRYDEATGKYIKWDANGDSGHYIRTDPETGEGVMAEIDGPGCIWRIWSANPTGTIRFYLDGDTEPTYEWDFNKLFRKGESPFPSPLVWQRRLDTGEGKNPASNCYMPIPFAKGCKVTADKPHRQYYHIGYSTFPADWEVKRFSLERTPTEEATLQRVCRELKNCGVDPQPVSGTKTMKTTVSIDPGQQVVLADLKGPAVIRQFCAKLESPERWARRKVLLQMYWDGAGTAAVEAPIGDFFGDAWDEATYQSLPMGITDELNYCFWRMPFTRSARIVVTNQGRKPAKLCYKIVFRPGKLAPQTARFHAKWRRDKTSQVFDYPMLECTGQGRFVGCVLYPDNIVGGWWGEGDEKVYVDGEKFPSTFGTGSEDYFGDAWGYRHFVNPYHGCPTRHAHDETRGQSAYRWHISDSIPFAESFKITIENYSEHRKPPRNDYSSMAYWYQAPGGSDFFKSVSVDDRIPQGPIRPGAIDAENLVPADRLPAGATIVSDDDLPKQLCNAKGLKISGTAGTTVTLTLPAPEDGRFNLEAVPAEGLKASAFELLKDGQPIGDHVRLAKGDNRIDVRLTGKPIDGDRCEVILDYLLMNPYRNFVRKWYLIGPFDNRKDVGFKQAYGPETEPFNAEKAYDGKSGEVRWQKIKRKRSPIDSRGKFFKDNENIVLYAYCDVVSPDDRQASAYVGSDDGLRSISRKAPTPCSSRSPRPAAPGRSRSGSTTRTTS